MKKIAFIILGATILLLGCSKSDDLLYNEDVLLKSADNGNYTEQFYFNPMGGEEYFLPIVCDGEEVDVLIGDGVGLTVHAIIHYNNGEMQWGKWLVKGELTSTETGETFKIHETNKGQFDENGDYYLISHTNAIGNKGTHYLFLAKLLWDGTLMEGEYIIDKAMCVPNKK